MGGLATEVHGKRWEGTTLVWDIREPGSNFGFSFSLCGLRQDTSVWSSIYSVKCIQ